MDPHTSSKGRFHQLIGAARNYSLVHGIRWWFVDLYPSEHGDHANHNFLSEALVSTLWTAGGLRIGIHSVVSFPRDLSGGVWGVPLSTRYDAMLSYIHKDGLAESVPPSIMSDRLVFTPHFDSLITESGRQAIVASRTSTRPPSPQASRHNSSLACSHVLSVGDAARDHGLSIAAARSVGLPIRVAACYPKQTCTGKSIGQEAAVRACSATPSPSHCSWDEKKKPREELLQEMESAGVCAVVVPLSGRSREKGFFKLGLGLTTIIEATARAIPVLTFDHWHFAGYLESGCNAVLLPLNTSTSERKVKEFYAAGLHRIIENQHHMRRCAERHATKLTLGSVASRLRVALRSFE